MENSTINTAFATRPCAWTSTSVSMYRFDIVGTLASMKPRFVNSISSAQARKGSLRPDHGAAKPAAPPRGDLR